MHPAIIHRGQMTLVGLAQFGETRFEIPRLWERFDAMEYRILNARQDARYLILTWGIETALMYDTAFIFIGLEVKRLLAPPLDVVIKIVPACPYAVFRVRASQVEWAWKPIFEEWMPASGYQERGFIVQRYDRARFFDSPPEEREVDICVPLRKKPEGTSPEAKAGA